MPGLLPDQQPQSQGLLHGFFNNGGLAGLLGMQPLGQRMVDESQAWNAQAKAAGMAPPPAPAWSPEATELADIAGAFDFTGAIKAYHGSPHTFDRFDMSKIGTGEGAQAYGHGLYFAESPTTAKHYQDTLSNQIGPTLELAPDRKFPEQEALSYITKNFPGLSSIAAGRMLDDMAKGAATWDEMKLSSPDRWHPTIDYLQSLNAKAHPPGEGSTYTVNLDVNHDDLLDWDAPLSQQPEKVRKALEGAGYLKAEGDKQLALHENGAWLPAERVSGQSFYQARMTDALQKGRVASSKSSIEALQPQASQTMRAAGIPGIRYLDGGSRGKGEGSHNFVMFDDALAQILERNGQPVKP